MVPSLLLLPPLALLLCALLVWSIIHGALFRLCLQLGQCLRPSRQISDNDATSACGAAAAPLVRCVRMHGLHVPAPPGGLLLPDKHQQEVLHWFEQHGAANGNCYTAFTNPEIEVFLAPGLGCLPYTVSSHWLRRVVAGVGDPVAGSPADGLRVLQLFRQAFPGSILLDVSKPVAQALVQAQQQQQDDEGGGGGGGGCGITVNDMGVDTVIDVQRFDPGFGFNKKTKHIRRRADMAARAGLVVEELCASSSPAIKQEVASLAQQWQQGKQCSGDVRVFSRAVPFQHLGQERGVRVFVARTLAPCEAPPSSPAAVATALHAKQQQAATAAAAPAPAGDTDGAAGCTIGAAAAPPPLSRKQRKLRERVQHARALKAAAAAAAGELAAAAAGQAGAAEGPSAPTLTACVIEGASGRPGQSQVSRQQEQPITFSTPSGIIGAIPPLSASTAASKAAADGDVMIDVECGDSPLAASAASNTASLPECSTSSTTTSSSSPVPPPRIHACVVLDPLWRGGRVVGYLTERSFLHPGGVKGAVKLVLREVVARLRAEGCQVLSLGLAVIFETKPGAFHGFDDAAWLARNSRLFYEHANRLDAFKNLAQAKACWGGGYRPDTDTYKYDEAVSLRRRFVVLPSSWRWQLGDGPFLMAIVFRHVGLLHDPWQLFAFWRFKHTTQPEAAGHSE